MITISYYGEMQRKKNTTTYQFNCLPELKEELKQASKLLNMPMNYVLTLAFNFFKLKQEEAFRNFDQSKYDNTKNKARYCFRLEPKTREEIRQTALLLCMPMNEIITLVFYFFCDNQNKATKLIDKK